MAVVRNVVVRLGADASELQRALQNAQRDLQRFGDGMANVGRSMSMAITAPIAGIGFAAIKTAADFEQGMSNIKAVSGATGSEMDSLRKLALKMGAETSFSAKEAASGIEELSKAGLTTEQILNGGLKGALTLAAAGGIELGEAAEIASTALNAFKNDNLTVADAANVLAGAANASATDVTELKMGLSAVSAVASGVGMSFKDTNTALATFAQNGLKGSDAGTSLKTLLLNLSPSTGPATEAMKQLGLVTADGSSKFYDASGNLKSFGEISEIMKTSMAGLSSEQQQAALKTMFGTDAIRAANIMMKEGAAGADAMATAMGKVSAEAVAAEKLNNFNGALEQLKGSLETLGIQIGSLVLPMLKSFADKLTELTNWMMTLSPETQKTIMIIAGIAAAIGPVLLVIGSLISAIGACSGALAAIGGVIGAIVSGPILIIVAAIAVVVAAFLYLWNTNEQFRNNMLALWEQIKTSLSGIFQGIKIIAIVVWNALKTFWANWGTTITALFKTMFEAVGQVIQGAFQVIQGIFEFFAGIFTGNWSMAWDGILKATEGIGKMVLGAITFIFTQAKLGFTLFGAAISEGWDLLWNGLVSVVTGIGSAIEGAIKGALNLAINQVNRFISFINGIKISIPEVNIPGVGKVGGGSIGFSIPKIPALETGTNYVPNDMLAMLHKGESVVPKQYNPAAGSDKPIVIYLDGTKIYEGIDYRLGSRLVGLGGV